MNYKAFDNIFTERKFPVEDCIIPDKKYLCLFNASTKYLCLIIDKRFPSERSIRIMSPYIWKEEEITCAWIDQNKNSVDNFENPVYGHSYNEFVIGWMSYKENNDREYLDELISKLISTEYLIE